MLEDPYNSITYNMSDLLSAFPSTRVNMRSPSFIRGSRYKRSTSALIWANISSRCHVRLVVLIVGLVLWTPETLESCKSPKWRSHGPLDPSIRPSAHWIPLVVLHIYLSHDPYRLYGAKAHCTPGIVGKVPWMPRIDLRTGKPPEEREKKNFKPRGTHYVPPHISTSGYSYLSRSRLERQGRRARPSTGAKV